MSLIMPITINDTTIGALVIRRTQTLRKGDQHYIYDWELTMSDKPDQHGRTRPERCSGSVIHDYDDGAIALIKLVLERSNL